MKSNLPRRAIETLALVLFIFFILACKCQSDLLKFGRNRQTPYPTPSSTPYQSSANLYSSPTPATNNLNGNPNPTSSQLSTGNYTGSGVNTTFNKRGDFFL